MANQDNAKDIVEVPNPELEASIQEAVDFLSGKVTLDGYCDRASLEQGLLL
ncbi:hypothetical protein [Loigolactobacillus bifermentans]|uniref:Uncharacterized protein n=1 Tax=Loigolactobacillus bifermentans DSM 20003 TaxID=1423726 RepID=A0A0R1H1Z8_9LACO|nr:hypothetical protein [Loigolactobacillus bifermentans]KRK40280.1 hypothetical protein FC07_GL001142 [Loigolactobacillus bifermentans DSM 20003]QGG58964.1 hypothetical protein LB003_00010 [Loigolactobacillus bifermentans]QGG61751.1 hypothetical protein LB003_15455 [Loigolactobacillus bifermentans]